MIELKVIFFIAFLVFAFGFVFECLLGLFILGLKLWFVVSDFQIKTFNKVLIKFGFKPLKDVHIFDQFIKK